MVNNCLTRSIKIAKTTVKNRLKTIVSCRKKKMLPNPRPTRSAAYFTKASIRNALHTPLRPLATMGKIPKITASVTFLIIKNKQRRSYGVSLILYKCKKQKRYRQILSDENVTSGFQVMKNFFEKAEKAFDKISLMMYN